MAKKFGFTAFDKTGYAVRAYVMLPWAVAKKPGYKGDASGLYFHFYRTEAEAEAARRWLKKNGKYQEPVKYMPGHCYQLGWVDL